MKNSFLNIFGGHKSFFWDLPELQSRVFGTPALDFKARVEPLFVCFFNGFLSFTCGATPADFLLASTADNHFNSHAE